MKIRPGLEIASLTDVGCQREGNEDSYGYWEPDDDTLFSRLGRLAVIADGMGGHEGGQIASRIAVDTVQQSYSDSSDVGPQEHLLKAFRQAHNAIQHRPNGIFGALAYLMTGFALEKYFFPKSGILSACNPYRT